MRLSGVDSPFATENPRNGLPFGDVDQNKARRQLDEAKISEVLRSGSDRCIVGNSPQIRVAFDLIRKYAASDAPVLITGETGTGKELIAHAIHARSARANGPLKVINCAAIPPSLIASELFGYEKGAFTGATTRKKGIIEAAHGGTLFLDEVGHLPADLQGYLLRVLQEKTIQMVGGIEQIPVDARIISATNVNFGNLITEGSFRSDLFFRLKVLTIHSPPLRERGGDILTLALFFLGKFGAEIGRPELEFSPAAEKKLLSYSWPGNIRELMSTIQRAVVVCDGDEITPHDLEDGFSLVDGTKAVTRDISSGSIRQEKKLHHNKKREQFIAMIRECDGNLTLAAERLEVSRMTLYRWIRRHRLDGEIMEIRRNCGSAEID